VAIVTELLQFQAGQNASILVEVNDDNPGIEKIRRSQDGIAEAGERLESAIARIRPAIDAVAALAESAAPHGYEVEFGIKLTGTVGAVVARSCAEGHFTVRLNWQAPPA
jgi:hypothetical protein